MSELSLRAANPTDLDELLALVNGCDGAAPWSRATWERVLGTAEPLDASRVVTVAVTEQRIVGFGVLHAVVDEAEVENLGVLAAVRRQGLGRKLCEALLCWAKANGVQQVHLEVRSRNTAAQALYRRTGFHVCGRRSRYYRDPEDDAVLMCLHLMEAETSAPKASSSGTL